MSDSNALIPLYRNIFETTKSTGKITTDYIKLC